MSKPNIPLRNLLVFGDGRVYETSTRLEGRIFYLTIGDRELVFEGEYAVNQANDFSMVFVERMGDQAHLERLSKLPEVKLSAVHLSPVDIEPSPHKSAWEIHRDCIKRGGHFIADDDRDECQICHLPGRTIHLLGYQDRRADAERQDIATLRDRLVAMTNEMKVIKVENSDLRRALDAKK